MPRSREPVLLRQRRSPACRRDGSTPAVSDALFADLRNIASRRDAYDSDTPGFAFDDVYHLAFDRVRCWRNRRRLPIHQSWRAVSIEASASSSGAWGAAIYRDFAHHRQTIRTAYSGQACLRHGPARSHRGAALSSLRHLRSRSTYSDANTLSMPTWLVDFTTDPWVALFFASDGGTSGPHGVVWNIFPNEYERHADGVGNALVGPERVVPSGIERISRQAGVFVVAAEPSLFEHRDTLRTAERARVRESDSPREPGIPVRSRHRRPCPGASTGMSR